MRTSSTKTTAESKYGTLPGLSVEERPQPSSCSLASWRPVRIRSCLASWQLGQLAEPGTFFFVVSVAGTFQPLFSEGFIEDVDEIYRKLGGHFSSEKLQNLQRVLARKGVQFFVVANQQLGLKLVSYYMDLKRRQTL